MMASQTDVPMPDQPTCRQDVDISKAPSWIDEFFKDCSPRAREALKRLHMQGGYKGEIPRFIPPPEQMQEMKGSET